MARKATVDRDTVLQMLKEGKTSQVIADRFGVSRQAIDLYRKQFTAAGILTHTPRPTIAALPKVQQDAPYENHPAPPLQTEPRAVTTLSSPVPTIAIPTLSLDQMVEVIIQAFTALKRNPELEAEITSVKKSYEAALQQVEQLKERERKRQEQEQRWLHAQQPGIMTYKQE
jgi:hypothetical protein